MTVYYEGVDISASVLTRSCLVRDTACGRCDSIEIVFEDAGKWFKWAPKEDDRIAVEHGGYFSGTMYVNTILPEDGRFRILATSLPCSARRKEYKSFSGKTVADILRISAVSTGMETALYGVEGGYMIPYFEQENESAAAMLDRLAALESAVLKCVQGRYVMIGILWAQQRNAARTVRITADQRGVIYKNGSGRSLRHITIVTPNGKGIATDTGVDDTHENRTISSTAARDNAQAGRWARGLLRKANRKSETLTMDMVFDPAMTAMARVDITGGTDADGTWLVEEAEHDLVDEKTRVTLHRAITSVI